MLEITRIRTEKEAIIEGMKKRNLDVTSVVDSILDKDEQWRSKKTEMETVSADLNGLAKEIGMLFKSGKVEEANQLKYIWRLIVVVCQFTLSCQADRLMT